MEHLIEDWPPLIWSLSGWLTVIGVIWKGFDNIEKVASPRLRSSTIAWLSRIQATRDNAAYESFYGIFASLIGTSCLSWRALRAAAVLFLLAQVLLGTTDLLIGNELNVRLLYIAGNMAITYVFTCKSILIVSRFQHRTRISQLVVWDVLLSVALVLCIGALMLIVMPSIMLGELTPLSAYREIWAEAQLDAYDVAATLYIVLLTVFTGSAPVLIYGFSGTLLSFLPGRVIRALFGLSDTATQPFRSIGFVIILVVSVLITPVLLIQAFV